jgi:hypothetical protein
MRSGWLRLKIGALALLLLGACDQGEGPQEAFVEQAAGAAQGFSETTARGDLVSADEDDWRTAPLFRAQVRVSPPYPNPASQTEPINLPVSLLFSDSVQGGIEVRARRADGRLIVLDRLDRTLTGSYVLTFNAAALGQAGLVRLFVFDLAGDLISYGDLMIR